MLWAYGTDGSAVLLEPDMARRVAYVSRRMRESGAALALTEGYRPVGVQADQHVRVESQTSTGGSNQWFQWGRYQRGETPSAAWPGTSRHGSGLAIDWASPTTADINIRSRLMAEVGLVRNVPSESWHAEPLAAARVDYSKELPVFSKLATATSGNAGQYSNRGRPIRGWIIHHAATTSLSGVLSMMSTGSRQVSANYVIDGAQVVGVVPEEYRAWTSASSVGDGENLTVEIVNDRVGSNDSNWTISDASYRSIAALVAETATRYGFAINRTNIIGHREVVGRYGQGYATACPSGVDLDRIVREARAIQLAGQAATILEVDMATIGRIFRVQGQGSVCRLATDSGVHILDTDDKLNAAFTLTGQDRNIIPTLTNAQASAYQNMVNWWSTPGVFNVLDAQTAIIKEIAAKVGVKTNQ